MKYTTKQFKYDVFEIHTDSKGLITNFNSLKKWIRSDLYFKYQVYKNSEGIIVLKVRDYMEDIDTYKIIGDRDVLMFPLDKNGKRYEDVYYPIFVKYHDFICRFE